MEELQRIWEDQLEFNRNFLPDPDTFEGRSKQTKEYVLCMMSELGELLDSVKWKLHRSQDIQVNPDQIRNELTDLLKYLISLYITWDISPEQAIQDYWRKSMVVRQRYSEEFILNLDGKIVICDIDGVLADYRKGFNQWAESKRLNEVHPQSWQELKHQFRSSGGKRTLPIMEEAQAFLHYCRLKEYKIVLLTSRPIDKYPNIYTDTVEWLSYNQMQYDFIWWAQDKAELILSKNLLEKIVFAVDDDATYIDKYRKLGIPAYGIGLDEGIQTIKDLLIKLKGGME